MSRTTTAETTPPVIEVEHIGVRYRNVVALEDVSLQLNAGTVCGLVGMNGSGKSTLFKAITGVLHPDSGQVRVLGRSPAAIRRSGAIGYVPQSEQVDWDFPLTVREVVMTGRYGHLGFFRHPRRADRLAVEEALARVELTDLAGRQIGQLSGGQRKRVFVARGIAQNSSVLLLDEPFAGVDKRTEATISRLLRELADAGATVLVSTHDLHNLPDLADQAILLNRRVLAQDKPDRVLTPENLIRAFGLDPLRSVDHTTPSLAVDGGAS